MAEERDAMQRWQASQDEPIKVLNPKERSARIAATPQSGPGPVTKGLSTALMQGAFEKFGQAFTRTGHVRQDMASEGQRMAPWREQGAKVAGALEMRWHTMEYENYQAAQVEPYMEAKKGMLREYKQIHEMLDAGTWSGPDGNPQQIDVSKPGGREQLIRLRGQLEKDFYSRNSDMDIELFNSAIKYKNNPLISDRIQAIATATSNQLMKATNPDQTLASEDRISQINTRERDAASNERIAASQAANAKQAKSPKSLGEALRHADVGPARIMEWLQGSPEGEDIMYGSLGSGAYLNAKKSMRAQILKDRPELSEDPDAVDDHLLSLEGRIRNVAAAEYLKRMDPKAYAVAKEATPHFFDFNTDATPGAGILGTDDERGIKGKTRHSKEQKKVLFGKWVDQWDAALDKWAADPGNPPDPQAAMEYMEQWVQGAIVNGAEGVPSNITIASNANTKALRAELIAALVERGSRTVSQNQHIKEAHPIAGLLGGIGGTGRPGGRAGRMSRARERQHKQGLIDREE